MDEGWSQSLDKLDVMIDGSTSNQAVPGNRPIIVERTLNARPAMVWRALTDPEQMKQWYFEIDGFKAEAGNEGSFNKHKDGLNLCAPL